MSDYPQHTFPAYVMNKNVITDSKFQELKIYERESNKYYCIRKYQLPEFYIT